MSLILSSIDIMGMGLTYIGISQEQQAKTSAHNTLPKGGRKLEVQATLHISSLGCSIALRDIVLHYFTIVKYHCKV
jgi:hypothetical protein